MKIPKYALLSVTDKDGLIPFAKGIVNLGYSILATSGTAKFLSEHGIKTQQVSEYTKFPEIFDGRVKTLHPLIFGGILAKRNNEKHLLEAKNNQISFFDLLVINLYAFLETLKKEGVKEEDLIEEIDIGGPSLLRAAAKNYKFVTVVTDKRDYVKVLKELKEKGEVNEKFRKKLAAKVFDLVSKYDHTIANYLNGKKEEKGELLNLHYVKVDSLRYGENPHQKAAFFRNPSNHDANVTNAKVLQGKQLSFNNIVDADAAIELIKDFKEPTCAFIKHTNPSGVASSDKIEKAFELAHKADPLSAFGGVIAMNKKCSGKIADYIIKNKLFVEILAAPFFSKDALSKLSKRENLRILEIGKLKKDKLRRDIKKVAGGILVQTQNTRTVSEKDLKTVTKLKPTAEQSAAMIFAFNVVKHVKSNAIVFAKKLPDGSLTTTGIGAGQMSRVDSVSLASKKGGDLVKGSSMASDAFFPFQDSVIEAKKAGIAAIIEPGGSIRDEEVIKKADELGITMVFTGIRAFKH